MGGTTEFRTEIVNLEREFDEMQLGILIVSAGINLLEHFYSLHSLVTVAIVFPNRTKPSTDLVKGMYQIDVIVAVEGEPNIFKKIYRRR